MATVTPNYGWPVPTSTDLVKDGATAIEALGDAIDATVFGLPSGGVSLIKSQTIGSAVASVNVTAAFNSTYDNYRIIISGGTVSTGAQLQLQLGASTTGYYENSLYSTYSSATLAIDVSSNGARFLYPGGGDTNGAWLVMDLLAPNLAQHTRYSAGIYTGALNRNGFTGGVHQVATAYTDFTVQPSGGTLTGGKIRVYGYANS